MNLAQQEGRVTPSGLSEPRHSRLYVCKVERAGGVDILNETSEIMNIRSAKLEVVASFSPSKLKVHWYSLLIYKKARVSEWEAETRGTLDTNHRSVGRQNSG